MKRYLRIGILIFFLLCWTGAAQSSTYENPYLKFNYPSNWQMESTYKYDLKKRKIDGISVTNMNGKITTSHAVIEIRATPDSYVLTKNGQENSYSSVKSNSQNIMLFNEKIESTGKLKSICEIYIIENSSAALAKEGVATGNMLGLVDFRVNTKKIQIQGMEARKTIWEFISKNEKTKRAQVDWIQSRISYSITCDMLLDQYDPRIEKYLESVVMIQ